MPPLSANLVRLNQAAQHLDQDDGSAPDHFLSFVGDALRQLRAPFLAHYSPDEAVGLLAETLQRSGTYKGPGPMLQHEVLGNRVRLWALMPDQPFIVDTIRLLLRQQGWEFVAGCFLMVSVSRDDDGNISAVGPDAGPLESINFVEVDQVDLDRLDQALESLRAALSLAQAAVQDFNDITEAIERYAHRFSRLSDQMPHLVQDLRETEDFLHWLLSDNFVFFGAVIDDQRLGMVAASSDSPWDSSRLTSWPELPGQPLVLVRKGRQESLVHRAGRVDEIRIEIPRAEGSSLYLYVQGLFTYRAVTQPSRHVPWLRRLLANILASQDSQPGSYRYKGIANVFDSLPTEFLFTASEAEITEIVERVLESETQQDARAHLVRRPHDDMTFALVAMPKSRWSEELQDRMEQVLIDATQATYSDHGVFVGRFDTMLVHYYLTGSSDLDETQLEDLRERLVKLATPWSEHLYQLCCEELGATRAGELLSSYGDAFDESYRRNTTPQQALVDINLIERLGQDESLAADLFLDKDGLLNLRVYQPRDVLLSDMLPVLDDFGLIVIDQYANVVELDSRPAVNLDTFRLKGVWGVTDQEVLRQGPQLVDGIEAVFARKVDDDVLNRVLLRADIPWQAVDMIRAYLGYSRQLGQRYTLARFQELLLAQPELAHTLWELFQARFDPDLEGDRDAAYEAVSERYLHALRGLDDHDQDMVFRTLFNLVDSTLRTNFYRPGRLHWSVSCKIDCAKVWNMPEPRMMYEIYVHHRVVEGLHLRGGPIARGGIRWSDRSDYRREVLDLVATQMVKNVLIVPEGAKGGFFLKKNPHSRSERRARADEMYEVFIRALLDVTDNIVKGEVVHPPSVVRHDGDDPYLVVAADKGTAHLSDTANRVSRSYGFWLDDAFASGGSNGYDHKECGITARGAWMTVARHFREMGVDPYAEDFTCVGIGDPSGDVFGNGVIETPHLRLRAAFNHLHVFLDPDPDTAKAFTERKRLFDECQGWDHYDESLISQGGGIFSRRAKSITLSPEAQKMLGTLKSELPVDAVIRLILRMNVDLFWNGGIGTYVKASYETHQQAKDPTNDELRINADELRCKVVGEGGNLGFTPEARIEYALRGGRLNTDAIDNSGGVDMSDHEVNLKILLSQPIERGDMDMDQRNTLLESLTETVSEQVLRNNDIHARQLSLDEIRSTRDPLFFWPTIQWVAARGGRSTSELHLPGHDMLKRRADNRQGLTRPELSVLQAHVKMHVFKDLMKEEPSLIPGFDEMVVDYFPEQIHQRFADDIADHMLHRYIGMTVVTTEVCGTAGATYFPSLMELTGASAARIAAAWFRAMQLIKAPRIRAKLLANTPAQQARYQAWIAVTDAALRLVATWLAPGEPEVTEDELGRIQHVLTKLPKIRGTVHSDRLASRKKGHTGRGVATDSAGRLAALGELTVAREIALLHADDERISSTIIRYLAIGEASRLLPAIRALETRRTKDRWDPVAMGILRNRFVVLMRELVQAVPVGPEVRLGVDRLARRLARSGTGVLAPLQDEMDRILGDEPDLPTLLVAEERVRAWITRFRMSQA